MSAANREGGLNEEQWFSCADPEPMQRHLRVRAGRRGMGFPACRRYPFDRVTEAGSSS
jgi:hypothetical protein